MFPQKATYQRVNFILAYRKGGMKTFMPNEGLAFMWTILVPAANTCTQQRTPMSNINISKIDQNYNLQEQANYEDALQNLFDTWQQSLTAKLSDVERPTMAKLC